jgi:bacterioferritin-associated ferredoxin
MYVCHCKAVSDKKVRETIRAGARTVEEIGKACGAGTQCFGCHSHLHELLAEQGLDDPTVATSL